MAVTQKVTLYNNKFTVPPVINAVQNDTDRQVEAYFGDFTLQVGMTGKLSFIRSDGTHYEVSATLNTGANTATAELDQALTQAGVTQAQLKITDSGNVGSTFTFLIKVQADVAGISQQQDGWSAQEFDQRLTDAENAIDAVEEDVADLQDKEYDYAPVITDTASGAIASFPDGADGYPLKECVVNIEAVQSGSGDPSPDNVRPISGWSEAKVTRCGKNFLPNVVENRSESNGITVDFLGDGEFHIYGTTTNNYSYAYFTLERPCIISVNYFHANNDATYGTTKCAISLRNGNALVQDIWLNSVNTVDEIMPSVFGRQFTRIMFATPPNYTVDYTCKLMLSANANDAYEPYNGQTVTIDLGDTRYGAVLDVTRGKLRVTHGIYVFTGNESQYVSVGQNRIAVKIGNNTKSGRAVCSDFANVETANNLQYIYITTSMTVDELKDYMTNHTVQCVYLIATPIEIDLTPTEITTLLGMNNLWSDTGDIEVEYCADTKRYIQKLISQLA